MKSRLSKILLVVGALIAFLPVVAVDYMLDGYVRGRETQNLQEQVQSITDETQRAVYQGVSALQAIMANSPSLCTPTFLNNVRAQLQRNIYLAQVVVENTDGVQYCDGYEEVVSYISLSKGLTIPGADETVSVAQIEGESLPSLKVTSQVGSGRVISAFVHISPRLLGGIPAELSVVEGMRLRLTDGTDILSLGDTRLLSAEAMDSGGPIQAHAVADALPMLTEAVVPFEKVRAYYADLDLVMTTISSLMSGAFLFLSFQYVRRARLQGFDLERAINNGELKPYYQPVMDMSTGRISGCEVLIRWVKKNGKVVAPNAFIDFAEASGLAIPMTIKLMEQVRVDLSDVSKDIPDLKIGINLFEGHFRDTTIVEDVQVIFDDSPISYQQLVFEITERRPLENQMATTAVIGSLQAMGCRLAIDDAGTGHSNLNYIQTLGVDIIKIDRTFVSMVEAETTQVPVLDGLIKMAQDMGADIIAEGVETQAQALYLREKGVVSAQGYLFAPAMKPAEFIKLARALNPKPAAKQSVQSDVAEASGDLLEDSDDKVAEEEAVA